MEKRQRFADDGLGENLVAELISDINEEIGQQFSDFFNIKLPTDAIARVLSHLSIVDLVRCGCVSRQWRDIAEDDAVWLRLVTREAQRLAARGLDEASAVIPAAECPEVGIKSWLRDRVRLQLDCDRNWRERVCVLYTAAWGTTGSRINGGGGFSLTSIAPEAAVDIARVFCFDFSTLLSTEWALAVGLSNGTVSRLLPSKSVADGESPLLAGWTVEPLPPPPPVPLERSELLELWPKISCVAVGGEWVASGDTVGQIKLWRLSDGEPGPALTDLSFRHGQIGSHQGVATTVDENLDVAEAAGVVAAAVELLTPEEASAAREELAEKQATLALLEREGWEAHDLPAEITLLQRRLYEFEQHGMRFTVGGESRVSGISDLSVSQQEDASAEEQRTTEPVSANHAEEGANYAAMAEQYLDDSDAQNAARAAREGLRLCPGHVDCTRILSLLEGGQGNVQSEIHGEGNAVDEEGLLEARYHQALEVLRGGDSPGTTVLAILACHVGNDTCWVSIGEGEHDIRLWQLADWSSDQLEEPQLSTRWLRGHQSPVHFIARCGDRQIASASSGGGDSSDVRVWDVPSICNSPQTDASCLCVVATGRAAHESITCLVATGPRLAVGLTTGDVRASAVPSGLGLPTPTQLGGRFGSKVLCVTISGSLMALGNAHGVVALFDTADDTAEALAPLYHRAHPSAILDLAFLDTVGHGLSKRGLLLATMSHLSVRLWAVKSSQDLRSGQHPAQMSIRWLWEAHSQGSPSMAIAVRSGRLLWLSQPLDSGRQRLQVFDFADRQLARADRLASNSLAQDASSHHETGEGMDDGLYDAGTRNTLGRHSEYSWNDKAEEDERSTQELGRMNSQAGLFGSLNSLLAGFSKPERNSRGTV